MKKGFLAALALLLCTAVHAQQFADPCASDAKLSVPINQTTPTTLITGASGRKNYICSIVAIGSDAETVSLIEGTGNTCRTSTPVALIGAATAASGLAMPSQGLLVIGNGSAAIAVGTGTAVDVCLLQSGTGRVGGVVTYTQR